jgi:hypothetical protein
MKKILCAAALVLALALPAQAVRYGLKKQVPIDSVTVIPEYLAYSPASHRMYCGGTWSGRVYWFDCLSDEPQGEVPGAISPAPMVYDSVNDRVYYKGGNEYFYAIDCAANALDTSWGGYQGGTLAEYNAVSNKIYLWDDFLDQTLIHSAATYAYQGMISPWKGAMHHFGPTNWLYVPHAWLDSLGVFDGASDARVTSIYLPGLGSNFNEKMASSPGSSRLYLSLPNTDQVAVVNTATNTLENVLAVGDNPVNFALCPLNNRMFIACNGSSQHSLQFINLAGVLDSVAVGDSVSVVAYNPTDSLIYIGCQRTGQIKLVDPRLATPLVVDSISVEPNLRYADMKVDQDGDVYCIASNYSDMFVVGKIPQRIWRCVNSGFWSEYSTWDYSDDGGFSWTGNAMMFLPNAATDSLIFIPLGYTVDVDYSATIDQMVINGGLNINADVTVIDGPGTDLQVDGFLQRQGGGFTVMSGASLVFGPSSNYNHQLDGDTIPTATWDSLSTIFITGVMSNTPAGMDQAFGNIVWDCFQQAGDHILPGGASFSVRDLSVNTTGPGTLCLTSASKPELTVNNLQIGMANALLGSGGNRKLHVKGGLTVMDPGWLYLTDSLSPGIDTLFLYGNYFHTLAGIAGGGPDSTAIVFCGADTQRYDGQGEMLTGHIDYVVFPGSHLLMPEWNVLGQGSLGAFKLMNGASLSYSDIFGLYPAGWDEGVIRNLGARDYSQGANYRIYSWGTGPYHAGPGLPDTVNQLIIESAGDQVYLDKDLAVMDTLKLLANYLNLNGHRLSLFGPIYQSSGNFMGDGASQLALMGGNTSPVSLPVMFRDVGTMTINRPAVITMSDTLLVHSRLELVNGTLDNGGRKLTFQDGSTISRSGNGSMSGAGPVVFVNQVGLEYGAGTITAGPEMPQGTWGISYLTIKGANDTLIVNNDTISISTSLSLPGGLVFNGRYFTSNGMIDTVGPAGELIVGDSCQVNFNSSYVLPAQLPGITGGSLFLNSIYGNIMRRDIICPGRFYTASDLTVGPNILILGDSLTGSGLLNTDSTSSLVLKGNVVNQTLPSSVSYLGYLSWDRAATLFVASPLVIQDSLKLGQGSIDNSANLSLKDGATIVRNSGILAMPPLLEGSVDVVYGSHGGGSMAAGNELPPNVTDLNNLTLSLGLLSNDTIALAGSVQVNGRLSLQQGILAVGANTLTLRDTIALLMGQLEADSLSNLWLLGCPNPFSLPANISSLGTLTLESPAGLTMADSLYIRGNYRQFAGHLLGGKLYYGPSATLSYNNTGLDTTSAREFPAAWGPRNLMVSVGGTLYLHDNRLVPGELTLASPLNTGASTITIDTFGVVSGGSFVDGKLAKLVPWTADTIIAYELGTLAGGSSPVSIQVFNNTVPALVTAGIKGSGHPLTNDSSACLKKVWSFSGAGLAADACQITLNYLASDFNTGFSEAADESTLVAGRYDNGVTPGWQFPNIISRNILGSSDGGSIVLSHAGNFTDNPDFTLGRDSMVIFNPAMDTTLPFIASNVPLDGASTVGLTDSVRITFSEPVKKSGVSYTFLPNPGTVDTAWSADSTTIIFNHSPFAGLTSYTVKVAGVQDTSGNLLAGRDSIGFMTQAASDTIGPYVSFVQPFDGQTGVRLVEPVMISFSEPVDSLSFKFTCTPNPGGWSQSWDIGSMYVTLGHNQFAPGATYSLRLDSLRDLAGNPLRSDTLAAPNPWTFTVQPSETLNTAWAGGAYRLVSLPLVPTDSTAAGNFGDDLGAYSDSTWRMFGYKPGAGYVENPKLSSGYGYWLASAGDAGLDVIGIPPEEFAYVPVESGWNLIGMPFDTTLELNKIMVIWRDSSASHYLPYGDPLVDSVFSQRLWSWNDPTNDLVNDNGQWDSLTPYNPADSLRAWNGYAGYAVRPCTLQISPLGVKGCQPKNAPAYDISWQAVLGVTSGKSSDSGIKIGVSPQAREKYDRLDAEKPPFIASTIKAYIPHQDWNRGPCREYQYDFRPAADYIEWPLMIETAQADQPVVLNVQITGELGSGGYLYLLDRKKGKTFDLKTQKTIGFSGSQELAVVYSSSPFDGRSLTPLTFGLGRMGPNPFIQRTTIDYQLPQAGLVNLAVYNITGQRVRTLVSQNLPPGYYSQVWDGRNDGGRALSAGVYIVRLNASGRSASQKIVKLQ